MKTFTAALVFLALCAPAAAHAQATSGALIPPIEPALYPPHDPFLALGYAPNAEPADGTAGFLPLPKYGGWVGVVKWVTLGTSVALGAIGFSLHNQADDLFAELTQRCDADPDNCRSRDPDRSYRDELLESLYQKVLEKDDRARISLMGAHISFGVSVLLFIVDFQKGTQPSDIPYDPEAEKSRLRLTVVPGEVAVRYYLR
jgi:hypothetical protein